MGQVVTDTLRGWPKGVNTSLQADQIGPEASPRAWNNDMRFIGMAGQNVAASRRNGMLLVNVTPMTGTPSIASQFEYDNISGGSNTRYHLLVGSNGQLWKKTSATAVAVADSTQTTPFSAATGLNYVSYAEAANLAFFANGVDLKKFNGTVVQNFGITRPSAPTIADSGVAGNHNGTYEARITFVNSTTGVESSASDASSTITVANKQINWTWTVSTDSQVDKVRLYIRNTSTMANAFEVVQIAVGTTQPYVSNVSDANLLQVTAPTTSANNPPPSTIRVLAWHKSRMFAADDTSLYYSQIGMPEQFDPNNFERVNPQDGQRIEALISAQEVLIILKRNSMYILVGDDPNSWSILTIDPSIGCVGPRSVVIVEGIVYWWSDVGPMKWVGYGTPQPIGITLIENTISPANIDQANLINISGAVDLLNQHIMWAMPTVAAQRCTFILPYNYRLQEWESDNWNPMDCASLAVVKDSNDVPQVYFGNYAGQLFLWWASTNDGMRDANNSATTLTKSGTVTTTAGQTSIMTLSPNGTVTFDTDGGGLVERYLNVVDATTGISVGRQRISSNNSTTVTVATSIPVKASTTYNWTIGVPDWQFDTAWFGAQTPFIKKRFTYSLIELNATTGITVYMDFFRNLDYSSMATRSLVISSSALGAAGSAIWDVSLWDVGTFEASSATRQRFRIGSTGRYWLMRIRTCTPDAVATLAKVEVAQELLTTRT